MTGLTRTQFFFYGTTSPFLPGSYRVTPHAISHLYFSFQDKWAVSPPTRAHKQTVAIRAVSFKEKLTPQTHLWASVSPNKIQLSFPPNSIHQPQVTVPQAEELPINFRQLVLGRHKPLFLFGCGSVISLYLCLVSPIQFKCCLLQERHGTRNQQGGITTYL